MTGSQGGVFFSLLLNTASLPSGPPGLTGPAPPSGPPRRSGLFRRYGYEMVQERAVESGSNPPTTRSDAGVLGETPAVAPQVAFSVYSVSVVYLRRLLILGSSNRGGVLESTRYTPYTLTVVDGEVCMFPTVSYLYPLHREIELKFFILEKLCVLEIIFVYVFLNPVCFVRIS